jgi:hypothetical protein
MKALIGHQCRIVFNLPAMEWPISGYPAWASVEAVDMPMILLKTRWGESYIWINSMIIKTIETCD